MTAFRGEERDGEQKGAVAELFVGETGFFGAEEQGYARCQFDGCGVLFSDER